MGHRRESVEDASHRISSNPREMAGEADGFKVRFKMSLADVFAAALAKERKAEIVTGDPEFKALEKKIKIHWQPNQ